MLAFVGVIIFFGFRQIQTMTFSIKTKVNSTFWSMLLVGLLSSSTAWGQAIESGFDGSTLAPNDDGSTSEVDLPFTVCFFGIERSSLWVNNNGNLTFDGSLSTFTPFDLNSTQSEIIAPFFADVDTRSAGDPVTYGPGTFDGRTAFGANYVNVDYFSSNVAHTNRNSFQVILVDRSNLAAGDFDIVFNYDQIQWETGTASGGDANGLGGFSARVGFSNGSAVPGTFFELAGSAVNGAFLDGGPNALISNRLNSDMDGRYIFQSRGCSISTPTLAPVPAGSPWSWLILLLGVALTGHLFLRNRQEN